jgi:cob(I)alamin adenosyltransferase
MTLHPVLILPVTGEAGLSVLHFCQRVPTLAAIMSIVTRTGDDGSTSLMYSRRVPKSHPRVEAYGAVDELNAALGLARAASPNAGLQDEVLITQKELVILMGELATLPEDLERYSSDGFPRVAGTMTTRLDTLAASIERALPKLKGWAMPGGNPVAAALDLARTICRRAERGVCVLDHNGELRNPEIIIYLNRLGDLLWLMARREEERGPE